MNKKLFFGLFAAAGVLFATSCSNEKLDAVETSDEAQVTFKLGLEGDLATRTISDGTKADMLVYAVYKLDENGNPELQNVVGSDNNGQFVKDGFKSGDNVTVTLAKGQTYQVAFWAQDADCKAYDTSNLDAVKVSYKAENATDDALNNDELRDAFFNSVEFEVLGDKTIDVVLRRPFAQINVGVYKEDWDAAVASGIVIENSEVVIKNVANTINLITGEVSGNDEVTYAANLIPDETLYVETDPDKDGKEAYTWLSMSYILVADAGTTLVDNKLGANRTTLESLAYSFIPQSGNVISFKDGLNSVPVQRNWRTNILGTILTGDVHFNITIDEEFEGDIIFPDPNDNDVIEELEFVATYGGTANMTGDADMTGKTFMVSADAIFNMNNHTLTVGEDEIWYGFVVANGTTTINDADIVTTGAGIKVSDGADMIFNSGNVQVNADTNSGSRYVFYTYGDGTTVTINGGSFSFTNPTRKMVYICADHNAIVYVKGGEFGAPSTHPKKPAPIYTANGGQVIITGGTFGFDPSAWVADGYEVVQEGGKWYVVSEGTTIASTAAEVVTAFTNGGNVVLASDITLDERLNVAENDNVILDMNGKTITLNGTAADPAFYTYKGSTLTITGNGTVEINDPSVSLMFPGGDVVIENGTFVRNVPDGTPANQVGAFFVGAKVSPWGSQTVTIKGGYFDGGYYNADAADVDDILAGTKTLTETADDIAKRGNSKDANPVRVAIKQNVQLLLNLSYNLFKIYGGTFVGANPAWGDEGCMLPTTPNYLRPWSYYQGALLDGQTFNENGIVLPEGYEITKGATADGRPTYTVSYN